ncbi:MKRN2 opposite strand protein [Condylostylus longicornis]|uniref:MKRN2 opposite strand protein n=1 Tax=Condylostylus longicornis TaxID=2530218 RepID=UPI00244E240C|nr:MKRN2 opposite strand protein [Condylostylus longicornis]
MVSSIKSDPGIICFQHCTAKIFSFSLPVKCPICYNKLIEISCKLMPFRVPYPFVKAEEYPCAIVLRPTNGDFLNDYNNSMDLHIGITNSKGTIYEFDRDGLRLTSKGLTTLYGNSTNNTRIANCLWHQSLLVENASEAWHEQWDIILETVCSLSCWNADNYEEETYNCYTFVLKFIQSLKYNRSIFEAAKSKTKFCELYIIPKTVTAGKYISLYRKIQNNGVYADPIKS